MTDVYMQPMSSGLQQAPVAASREALEMQAFEKGRIQGELEASRRMEAEREMQGKQMLPAHNELNAVALQRPDVIEINRLTWPQRIAYVLGQLGTVAFIALTVVWLDVYRGGFEWRDARSVDGSIGMYNTFLLTSILGLAFLGQAITFYRFLPINMPPWMDRIAYLFLQSCAIVCWCLAMTAVVRATPESTFWSVADWCFALAFAVTVSHGLYSMIHTLLEPIRHNHTTANKWNESNSVGLNHRQLFESPEQMRDHSTGNQYGRSVYAPAPVNVHSTHASNVPAAPGNAPRWAENPNTHAEDYWLLPRAKWAVVGFWAVAAAILMQFAAVEHVIASGMENWAQGPPGTGDEQARGGNMIDERGRQADLIGALGLVVLFTTVCLSYVAMPPRTTLVKNGVLQDQTARRTSVSHNAETRLGHNVV